jgi:DNA-binding transcriptional MerR regulator
MNKSPEAFRTISEVAEALDVPPHVLRFWETRFAQVKPVKRGGGRRYYRPEDVRLLRGIRGLLYDDGMTIKGVQKILRERGIRHVIGLGTVPEAELAPPPAPPKAKPRAAANGAPPPGPQADLFDTGASPAPAARGQPKPLDKAALKRLLGKLMALRAVMTDEPRG